VAYRYCQRVRRVIGSRQFRQIEQSLRHQHDLHLLRASVAHDSLLDLQRRIFKTFKPFFPCRQKQNAAPLRDLYRRCRVRVEKQFLKSDRFGLVVIDEFAHVVKKLFEPVLKRRFCGGLYRAVINAGEFAVYIVHNAEPDGCVTGVYAQNSHSVSAAPL